MIGQTISHYQILEKLGEGGMAVVYKARDVRLGRNVALKFVNAQFNQRWEREARLVAAFNHPHVATLYDMGEHEGSPYLAMEFVNGVPLKGPRSPKIVVEYGIQIADALEAAHAANVVHRDLKPANILVTPTGAIKVLDFGLGRLSQALDGGLDETRSTLISGTPGYMAPEQFEGAAGDVRSDIFSFGCVLYELASGRRAFPGESVAEIIGATAAGKPLPLANMPESLQELIFRCIRKDPKRRFQSMTEVKSALEDLHAGLLESTISGMSLHSLGVKRPRWLLPVGLALLTAVCAAGAIWFVFLRNWRAREVSSGPLEITRLTAEGGLNVDPAISPDGKLLAYASDHDGSGNLNLWMKQVEGGDAIRLTNDAADDVEPSFSPDGTRIVFRSSRDGGGIYLMPALGGTPQKLFDGGHRPRFSPDGSKIAYWSGIDQPIHLRAGTSSIHVFDIGTSTGRQLRTDFAAATEPVWSPDGKSILFLGLKDATNIIGTYDLWVTPLEGGTAIQCHVPMRAVIYHPFAWRQNNVYVRGWDSRVGVVTLDPQSQQETSKPVRLTTGTTDEDSPTLSADGRHLVFASLTGNRALYALPLAANGGKPAGPPEPLTFDDAANYPQSISADGKRMVFISDRSGVQQVWAKDLTTGDERALTTSSLYKWFAVITRDGKLVAWKINSINDPAIFATPFDGGATERICANCGTPQSWSPDGKYLAFSRAGKGGRDVAGLLSMATHQGSDYLRDPQLGVNISSISDDGRWIAFDVFRSARDFSMYVAPFSPNHPPDRSLWVPIPIAAGTDPNPRWSPNGDLLYFSSSQDGHSCIWAERLEPGSKHPMGQPFAVEHFHSPSMLLSSPSFTHPVVLASDKIILGLTRRSGSLWMLKLTD